MKSLETNAVTAYVSTIARLAMANLLTITTDKEYFT